MKVVPFPGSDSHHIRPPCLRTNIFTYASPMPSPGTSCFPALRKIWKNLMHVLLRDPAAIITDMEDNLFAVLFG